MFRKCSEIFYLQEIFEDFKEKFLGNYSWNFKNNSQKLENKPWEFQAKFWNLQKKLWKLKNGPAQEMF